MIKLLLILIVGFAIALTLLQLRQQKLELNHRTSVLHAGIQKAQTELWRQQVQLGTYTTPAAIENMTKSGK